MKKERDIYEFYNPGQYPLLKRAGKVSSLLGNESETILSDNIVLYENKSDSHRFVYYLNGVPVSVLHVTGFEPPYIIANVFTEKAYRRKKYALELLNIARETLGEIQHSDNLSQSGRAWSESVGEPKMNRQLVARYKKGNPPWADKAISSNESRIKRAFGAKSLPEEKDGEKYIEIGCGSYGCVYATNQEEKVLKITSDATEIELVKFVLKQSESSLSRLEGLVRYYGILDLKTTHNNRPVYAILREEAYNIGLLLKPEYPNQYREQVNMIMAFKWFAERVRDMFLKHSHKPGFIEKVKASLNRWNVEIGNNEVKIGGSKFHYYKQSEWKIPSWLKSSDRAAFCLIGCRNIVEAIMSTPDISQIGEALAWFMCLGKLLADVHLNNIGQVIRVDNYNEPILAITDPGHAVDIVPIYTYMCQDD